MRYGIPEKPRFEYISRKWLLNTLTLFPLCILGGKDSYMHMYSAVCNKLTVAASVESNLKYCSIIYNFKGGGYAGIDTGFFARGGGGEHIYRMCRS